MKKIMVHLPAVAKCVGGGVATQAEMTTKSAENYGIPIIRYNPWHEYNWDEIGAVHIFRGDYETHNFAKLIHDRNIPLLISPVFFSSHSAGKIRLLSKSTALFRKILSGLRTDFDYVSDVAQLATQLLPNTKAESILLSEAFDIPLNKFTVVPNGVDNRFAKADAALFQSKYGHNEIMLTVANLGYRRKNMLNAIRAASKTEIPYYIIGPNYSNNYGKACLSEIEKAPNIHYIGALDNDSPMLASAYAAAKLFLLPSLFETPGIASMEAALAGAEVITTPYGGPKEYFGQAATYVEPNSVSSITEGIKSAWGNKPKNPAEVINQSFLWDTIGKQMADIYRLYL